MAIEVNEVKNSLYNSRLQLIERITNNIIVKQMKQAEENDTEEWKLAFYNIEHAINRIDEISDYSDFPIPLLATYFPSLPSATILDIHNNIVFLDDLLEQGKITQTAFDDFLDEMRLLRVNGYIEPSPYYRMLLGYPPLDTDPSDYVYVYGKPIQDITEIEYYKLKRDGLLDVIIANNPDKEYLKYIGKKIELVQARNAEQFEVLWVADVDESNKYRELFNKERKVFLVTYHHEHLTMTSDFNEAFELMILKMRAAIHYVKDLYQPTINKTSFTKEESEDLFKECGLSFPRNMPSAYRDSITFVLQYMVMWKGTNHAVKFIANKLFKGLNLYTYFVRRYRKPGTPRIVPEGTPATEVYDVDFVLRDFDATNVPDFKEGFRKDIILTYDDIVAMDPRWSSSQELKEAIFSSKFSYTKSKYIAIDNIIDLNDFGIAFSVLNRMIVEHKDIFSDITFTYPNTGTKHTFFNLWQYFIAIYCAMVYARRSEIPDSLSHITKLMGFKIPDNIKTIQIYWIWYFNMTGFGDELKNFPDALNNSDTFMELLIKMDKSIGLAKFLDGVLAKCETFQEVDMVQKIYKLIRIVNTTPASFNVTLSATGNTYADYLEIADPLLFIEFEKSMTADDPNVLILEMDNLSQYLIKLVEDHATTLNDLENIINVINTAAIMVGGISKYLVYILKLFKAYTTDFLNDTNLMIMDENYNYQLNICQPYFDINITLPLRWNMSQYDWAEINKKDIVFYTAQSSIDGVYLCTDFGDIKISE